MPAIQDEFYRIQKLPPYVFAVINEMKAQGTRGTAGCDRSRDGQSRRRNAASRRQQADGSDRATRATTAIRMSQGHSRTCAQEIVKRYQPNYGVDLDPEKEAIVTIGAKDALAHLLFAIIGPGDVVVSPNPAYPIHQYGVIMAEGHACMLPMPDAGDVSERPRGSVPDARRASRR